MISVDDYCEFLSGIDNFKRVYVQNVTQKNRYNKLGQCAYKIGIWVFVNSQQFQTNDEIKGYCVSAIFRVTPQILNSRLIVSRFARVLACKQVIFIEKFFAHSQREIFAKPWIYKEPIFCKFIIHRFREIRFA